MTHIFFVRLLLLTVSLACIDVQAQNNAVSSYNGDVSIQAMKVDSPDADINFYAASVNGNIPLPGYLGVNLYVAGGHGDVESVSLDYSYDYLRYAVSPFVRNPKLGLIGLSYGRTTFSNLGAPFAASSLSDINLGVLAAGYFGPATVSASYTQSQDVDNIRADQNNGLAGAVWYVTPDFLVEVGVGFSDAKDSYGLAFEHQPSSLSPNLSYGLSYSQDNDLDDKAIQFVVTYRIAEKKSLMKRYREDLFGPR